MGFESGSIGFRLFWLPRSFPEDAAELFAEHAAPPLSTIGEEPVHGWVTGRHMLDRHITAETAFRGQYLYLAMQQAERKIPSSLLRAECKMEELALMAAEEKPFVSRQERAEIKKSVMERLLPQMPPQIKGTPLVYSPGATYLYATALPAKQCDVFTALIQQTLGFAILPCTPELAALQRTNTDVNQWNPISFSPDVPRDLMEVTPGRDFLTWLLFHSEACGGSFSGHESGVVHVMLEGPLLFTHEGGGAYEIVLRKGEPLLSTEAKSCLLSGKKLRQARVTFAIGEEIWAFNLDADELIFRNLSLPKIEEVLDASSHFEERIRRLERFLEIFFLVFDHFTEIRSSKAEWNGMQKDIFKWVQNRIGKI
ncbi:MAG: recombination-associated protein RdgC [Kiritimatiellae bacterium]|nr:recombination-associated protein RdgC [Kiritimatiellia bacterium]